jgi:hypothetical protein
MTVREQFRSFLEARFGAEKLAEFDLEIERHACRLAMMAIAGEERKDGKHISPAIVVAAMKHAFPEKPTETIQVFRNLPQNQRRMIVVDDAVPESCLGKTCYD